MQTQKSSSPFWSCVCINMKKHFFMFFFPLHQKKKQWSDFFNCEITFNFLLYFYVLQMNECTNLNRKFKHERSKIIVSIPLEPFIAFRCFWEIYDFKCFSFSTFEIQRDCVISTFYEISFFSLESWVTQIVGCLNNDIDFYLINDIVYNNIKNTTFTGNVESCRGTM